MFCKPNLVNLSKKNSPRSFRNNYGDWIDMLSSRVMGREECRTYRNRPLNRKPLFFNRRNSVAAISFNVLRFPVFARSKKS